MLDSTVKLATCNRCRAYVLVGNSDGQRVAADPAPVTQEAYIASLVAGRRVFDLLERAGRPHKLLGRGPGSSAPSWTGEGGTGLSVASRPPRKILAEHGCGAKGISSTRVEVTEVPDAPVEPACVAWERQGWVRPPRCPRYGREGSTAPQGQPLYCGLCQPPPFDRGGAGRPLPLPSRCDTCAKPIREGEMYSGVYHLGWRFAMHERCD